MTARTTIRRKIKVNCRYLWLPIQPGAQSHWMNLKMEGTIVRQFSVELIADPPEHWVFTDIDEFQGREITIECTLPEGNKALDNIRQSDERPHRKTVYREKLRPQYHFSSQIGRLNDPNGLVHYDGEYHLFYQHNPLGAIPGNKSWGHAISRDLLHWQEMDTALHPDALGLIFSGSTVVDHANTAGFAEPGSQDSPIIAIYTSFGSGLESCALPWADGQPATQSIAVSLDRGRSFTKYSGNPVLQEVCKGNRDPKVFWHESSQHWIMVLHLDTRTARFGIFSSPNLKEWKQESDLVLPETLECPDLFQLSVDRNPADVRWIFWVARGRYLLGQFDGKRFQPTAGPFETRYDASEFAGHTFSNIPGDRIVQMAWIRSKKYPNMSFDQQMTVPRELTLRTTEEDVRLFIEPVEELASLRGKMDLRQNVKLAGVLPMPWIDGKSFDLETEIDLGSARRVGLHLFGGTIEYEVEKGQLIVMGKTAPLQPIKNRITLRILVDRISCEVFANKGIVQMAECIYPKTVWQEDLCSVHAIGGEATIVFLKTWPMRSVWQPRN